MGLHDGGGNCLKYLKRGWNSKEARGNKDFKKRGGGGGKLGQGVGALKRKELEPLTNYVDNLWEASWYFRNSSNYRLNWSGFMQEHF